MAELETLCNRADAMLEASVKDMFTSALSVSGPVSQRRILDSIACGVLAGGAFQQRGPLPEELRWTKAHLVDHIKQRLLETDGEAEGQPSRLTDINANPLDISRLPSEDLLWMLYGGEYTLSEDGVEACRTAYLEAYTRENPWLSESICRDAAEGRALGAKIELEAIRRDPSDLSEAPAQ